MEVLGTAVGIASLGIQVCQGLLTYYSTWKTYDSDITEIYNSVADLSKTLTILHTALQDPTLDEERSDRVESCLQSCVKALTTLSVEANKLRKHAQPEGSKQKILSAVQRLQYPFQASTLKKLKEAVSEFRGHLQLALQILHLETSQQTQKILVTLQQSSQSQQKVLASLQQSNQFQHETLGSIQKSDQHQKLIKWLAASDPWTNHASARKHHEPHTGDWLLQSPMYQRWKKGSIKHLWLFGKAGCGKTVICSTAIEDMKAHCESQDDVGFAVFYFTFSDQKKQTYEDLLRSLAAQLGSKGPGLAKLLQVYDNSNGGSLDENKLEGIVAAAAQAYPTTVLMLDALDESPEESDARENLLKGLETLARSIPSLRVCATSRELRGIHETMGILEAEAMSIETAAVDADIKRYVSRQLSSDRRLARINEDSKALILRTISEKADGMFRWAYCQLLELRQLKFMKRRFIEEVLKDLPKTLDDTYQRMLANIGDRYAEDALNLLRWIAFAQRPLSLVEVHAATSITLSDDGEDEVENLGDEYFEGPLSILEGLVMLDQDYEYTQGSVEGLVIVVQDHDDVRGCVEPPFIDSDTSANLPNMHVRPESRVRLAHFSVQEYLMSDRILGGPAKRFHLSDASCEDHLAQSCLSYFIHYSKSKAKTGFRDRDTVVFPLLAYAATYWPSHLRRGELKPERRALLLLSTDDIRYRWVETYHVGSHDPFGQPNSAGAALSWTIRFGHCGLLRALLDDGALINARGRDFGNALQAAAHLGLYEIVQTLLDHGADVNARGYPYHNALQAAILGPGNIATVRLLLEGGADINALGGTRGSALQVAVKSGSHEIVRLLLDRGADVDAQGNPAFYKGTALQTSLEHDRFFSWRLLRDDVKVLNDRFDIASMLLDAGAKTDEIIVTESVLKLASKRGYSDLVQTLRAKCAVRDDVK